MIQSEHTFVISSYLLSENLFPKKIPIFIIVYMINYNIGQSKRSHCLHIQNSRKINANYDR